MPSRAPALLFYIIMGVQGSRRQIESIFQKGSAGEWRQKGHRVGCREGRQKGGRFAKNLNELVHQMQPFSTSIGEMSLPHLAMLDVIVSQRVPEPPTQIRASLVAAWWSIRGGIPCALALGQSQPRAGEVRPHSSARYHRGAENKDLDWR